MTDLQKTPLADGRVYFPRVADVVADQIRELIVTGELTDGERLPRLEVLLEQFGVSGPSMREALRMLESEGLITVQRGSIGGAVVHRPNAVTAAHTLAMVMRSRGTQLSEVFETMALLEPVCAMLCARRSDRKRTVVRELRKVNARSRSLLDGDTIAWNEAMSSFHKTVVQRCGNDALTLLVGVLESILLVNVREWAETSAAHGTYPTRRIKVKNLDCHEQICDLIEAGDDVEVARTMTDHIDEYVHLIYSGEGIDPDQQVSTSGIHAGP